MTKTNTLRVETFRAPELGILGYVDEDRVSYYRATTKRHTPNSEFDVTQPDDAAESDDPVLLHRAGCDADSCGDQKRREGHRVRRHRQRHLSIFEANAVKEIIAMPAASRPALVRSSRVGNGRVTPTEFDAHGHRAVGHAHPQKARILLMLALTKTSDPKESAESSRRY